MTNKGRRKNGKEELIFCKNGHELTGDNVRIEVTGFRRCVKCRSEYGLKYRQHKKDEQNERTAN
jgi:hypothetical protein